MVQCATHWLRVGGPEQRRKDPKGDLTISLVHSVDDLEEELVDVEFDGRVGPAGGGLGDVGRHHIETREDDNALLNTCDLLKRGLARLTRFDLEVLDPLTLVGPNVVNEVRVSDSRILAMLMKFRDTRTS